MEKKNRSSVFIRYALSYLAVVMTLFFSIVLYLYLRTGARARQELIDSQINRLNRIASQHEMYISSMLSTAEEIGLSPHIEAFDYDLEPWKAYDLQLQLIPYTSTSTFCDQVYLHFTGDDRVYSSASSLSLSLFARMMHYEHIGEEAFAALISSTDSLTILPSQHITSSLVDTSQVITFLVPLGANPGTSKGILVFPVKDHVYQSMFSDAIDENVNTYIFQDGTMLSCAEDMSFSREMAVPGESMSRTLRWEGEDWTVVSLKGRSLGMSYSAVLRNRDMNAAVGQEIFSNLAILPLFMALCLVLALYMARRQAQPIRDLSGMLAGEEGVAEKKDELQQISSGIRRLATSNRELRTRLDRALPMQRHDFVFQFMKGRFSTREEAVSAGHAAGLEMNHPYYAVILLSAEDLDHPFELSRPPFDRLEGLSGAGVELVALKATLYLAFAEDADTLSRLAEMLRAEGENGGGRCVTAISAVHTDYSEAPSAYLEAAAAYDNRFVMGMQKVLFYSDISSDVTDILPQAQKLTTSINQALALGSLELLNDRIDDLLHFLRNTHMSPFAFRLIYSNVINTLVYTHADAFSGNSTALDYYNIFMLSSCQSIDDLDELLRKLCDLLLNRTQEAKENEKPEEDEISQSVRYMEDHFSDPEISMTAIADSLELSTTRFSMSFKEKMGMTPLEYLTLLRVEKAKELLTGSDMPIRDVSSQVGYYDSGSFIRRFKQVVGETPLQYRRGHGRQKDPS